MRFPELHRGETDLVHCLIPQGSRRMQRMQMTRDSPSQVCLGHSWGAYLTTVIVKIAALGMAYRRSPLSVLLQ